MGFSPDLSCQYLTVLHLYLIEYSASQIGEMPFEFPEIMSRLGFLGPCLPMRLTTQGRVDKFMSSSASFCTILGWHLRPFQICISYDILGYEPSLVLIISSIRASLVMSCKLCLKVVICGFRLLSFTRNLSTLQLYLMSVRDILVKFCHLGGQKNEEELYRRTAELQR